MSYLGNFMVRNKLLFINKFHNLNKIFINVILHYTYSVQRKNAAFCNQNNVPCIGITKPQMIIRRKYLLLILDFFQVIFKKNMFLDKY